MYPESHPLELVFPELSPIDFLMDFHSDLMSMIDYAFVKMQINWIVPRAKVELQLFRVLIGIIQSETVAGLLLEYHWRSVHICRNFHAYGVYKWYKGVVDHT